MFVLYNANPARQITGDCTVRAIAKLTGEDWETVYAGICAKGFEMKRMPEDNPVWGAYLKEHGYKRHALPDTCPDCYTVAEFCRDYPAGTYLLATGSHVVAVENGDHYDTWGKTMEKVMDKVCEMFHDVLYDMTEKGHFNTASDVQTAKAAVSGIVKIKTLEAMKKYGNESSFRGHSYDSESRRSYENAEESRRQGRGSDGRFVSRDSMRDKLEELMQEADGRERKLLGEMLSKM